MALRRRKKFNKGGPERLQLFHRKGGSWARDLEAGSLGSMLDGALASGGIEAPIAWEQTGQLGTAVLIGQWPDFLEAPAAVYLRRNPRKPFGLELSVDLEGDLEVQEYGEDLRRYLVGEARLTEFQAAVPVAEPDQVLHETTPAIEPRHAEPKPAAPARPAAKPSARPARPPRPAAKPSANPPTTAKPDAEPSRPAVKPAVAAAAAKPKAVPVEPAAPVAPAPQPDAPTENPGTAPEPVAEQPRVEVFAPGERINKAKGRTWTQSPDDLFGLAGEIHPDDDEDHGLEIGTSDLPWLNPGDAIISPRRGPCRIKRVEDEARQVVAKDENKQMLVLSFDELLAEFQFDDGD